LKRTCHSRKAILALMVFYAVLPAAAAGGVGAPPDKSPVRVTTEIDRLVIRVGELIHYSLSIQAPPGSNVMMPPPGAQLGSFLIRDYSFPGEEENNEKTGAVERVGRWIERKTGADIGTGDRERTEFRFTVTTYRTGDMIIPPVPVIVVDPGGKTHRLFAESARVRVVPVTDPRDLTIKDVEGPVGIEIPVRHYLPWAALPAALLAAAALLLWRLSRREAYEPAPMDTRPAHVIAMEDIAALEREGLLEAGDYRGFYTGLSRAVRKYLALRFGFYALEYTTSETAVRLRDEDLSRGDYELITGLLEEADRVKFAKAVPAIEQRSTALERARTIVRNTREPEPEEERLAA